MLGADELFNRHFDLREVYPTGSSTGPESSDGLDAFGEYGGIVLLGEPGIGKSVALQQAATRSSDALFVTVRELIRAADANRFYGRTLYIDALDEVRSQTNEPHGTLDRLITRLQELGRPRFVVSCRTLDWYGSTDLRALSDASSDRRLAVLSLAPLSDTDIAKAIRQARPTEADHLISKVWHQGLAELARNPLNLKLLLESLSVSGDAPTSRLEVYLEAIRKLVIDVNPDHAVTSVPIPTDRLIRAAGFLSAVALCSNVDGFGIGYRVSSDAIAEFPDFEDRDASQQVAHSRVFKQTSNQILLPHRNIAEFLAASFIAEQVRQHRLSLTRAISIVAPGNQTIANLRGLYAWLATLLPEHANGLISIDPLAVAAWGDPSALPSVAKESLVEEVARLGAAKPWVAHHLWEIPGIGGLASPDLENSFHQILRGEHSSDVAKIFVLEAIIHGAPLKGLANLVRSMARKRETQYGLRAIQALVKVANDPERELEDLLSELTAGLIPDEGHRIRGFAMQHLYPNKMSPRQAAALLVRDESSTIGEYQFFVSHELVENTPVNRLPELLESLGQVDVHIREDFSVRRLIGAALSKLLRAGVNLEPALVYEWLGLCLDRYGHLQIEGEHRDSIRRALDGMPELYMGLFRYWISTLNGIDRSRFPYHQFLDHVGQAQPPAGFPRFLLNEALAQSDEEIAHGLITTAVIMSFDRSRADALTLDEVYEFAERHPQFARLLLPTEPSVEDCLLYLAIPEWRQKNAIRKGKERAALEELRRKNVAALGPKINAIRQGTEDGALIYLCEIYLHGLNNRDELEPYERLAAISSNELAEAALAGAEAILWRNDLPDPSTIGRSLGERRIWRIAYPVLVGLDRLADGSSRDLLRLPRQTLSSALCLRCASEWTEQKRTWPGLVAAKYPELATQALLAFWRAFLQAGGEHISFLHDIVTADAWKPVTQAVLPALLEEFPYELAHRLRFTLLPVFRSLPRTTILEIVTRALQTVVPGSEEETLWLGVGAWCEDEHCLARLNSEELRGSVRIPVVAGLVESLTQLSHHSLPWLPSAEALATFIEALATLPRQSDAAFATGHTAAILGLIQVLAKDQSRVATDSLQRLIGSPATISYRDVLGRAIDEQAAIRRDAEFSWPTPRLVASALRGGIPANIDDFLALASDELRHLAREIRDGATNRYKAFWAGDSPDAVPAAENIARDRLAEWLQPFLGTYAIRVETEVRHADDRRSDIQLVSDRYEVPIEIKRHMNAQLWSAAEEQLGSFYQRSPHSHGRGIYLVLWYGEPTRFRVPSHPTHLRRPDSPQDLETLLRDRLPDTRHSTTKVIVIDVSRPNMNR